MKLRRLNATSAQAFWKYNSRIRQKVGHKLPELIITPRSTGLDGILVVAELHEFNQWRIDGCQTGVVGVHQDDVRSPKMIIKTISIPGD